MVSFIYHFFTPQTSNNYRPRLLHPKILLLLTLFFFSAGLLMSFAKTNYPEILGISSDVSIDQLLILTNQKRQESGLPPLSLDGRLNTAAANKGSDMLSKGYWAHIAPDGATPWVFIRGAGYNYTFAGENLARGYTNTSDVINAWMASQSHKDNILSPNYNNVGFAVVTGNLNGEDTVVVVEMFGSTTLAAAPSKTSEETVKEVATGSTEESFAQVPKAQALVEEESSPSAQEKTNTETVASNVNPQIKPLINAETFSSNLASVAITIFMFVFILDMIIIERKKILRFVGHNLDHIMFLGLILALILVIIKGYIV